MLAPDGDDFSAEDVQQAYQIVGQRLESLAAAGQISGGYTLDNDGVALTVRLNPGEMPLDDILKALTTSRYLEFVDFSTLSGIALTDYTGQPILTSAGLARTGGDAAGQDIFPTVLTHTDIDSARAFLDDYGQWVIEISLTPDGAIRLGEFSEAHIGLGMAIVLDGIVLSIPTIQSRVESPVILSGTFTELESLALAVQIDSQPLTVTLRVESVTQIQQP